MRKLAIGAAVALTASLGTIPQAQAAAKPDLAKLVTLKDVRTHLDALQKIATYNGGTRAAGTPGYEISTKYVVSQLKKAGYKPTVQPFDFDFFRQQGPGAFDQVAPEKKAYTVDTDYNTMEYSAGGEVTANAVAVDPPAAGETGTSGCEAEDFAGFPKGAIALVQRGNCNFSVKTDNAEAAGAVGVVIYNRPDVEGPVTGATIGKPTKVPTISTPNALGRQLVAASQAGTLTLHVKTETINERRKTQNVIAETKAGRADNVVLLGAHLDSVPAGPGINDNGTGSASILAIAQKIGKLGAKNIKNKVRFAWWGAEEIDLVGSTYYVTSLTPAQKAKIALNLNFDMLGSPNGIRGVYDGDDSSGAGTNPPAGSGAIEKVFKDYYAARKLPTAESEFNGRSDYGPFIENGIPAGGIDTGAEGIKTAEEAALFGGTAGLAYDPCYHQACDTVKNVDYKLLDTNVDGIAFATQTFAKSTLPVNGEALRAAAAARAAKRQSPYQGGHLLR
ncbi:M28 family peptidase [Actinomadura parmotrematis]|uniref:M28 family peptidase n=1 Tax=Actinomadura parmotrematis TaxID=2864039 RepID=A0ABS7FW40_9ACTN|nr:M28 family peptidase [Actinomadura parmotrematis]MBW8483894.1 M28 family peptidase [Actinomadura parmotrematis]